MIARGPIVYFIRGVESGRIKIGTTIGWAERRMRALQTGSPEQLEFLCYVPGGREREQELHAEFSDCNVRGEWFDPHPELINFIEAIRRGVENVRRVRALRRYEPPRCRWEIPPVEPQSDDPETAEQTRSGASGMLAALLDGANAGAPIARRRA